LLQKGDAIASPLQEGCQVVACGRRRPKKEQQWRLASAKEWYLGNAQQQTNVRSRYLIASRLHGAFFQVKVISTTGDCSESLCP
jgi:hypothetical protein